VANPLKVWQYHVASTGLGEGWAEILIREDGFFAAVSDFGNYAFWWRSTGTKDVREFFLRSERDWDYFARKLGPEEHVDARASFESLFEEVLKERSKKELTKEDARDRYAHLKYYASDDDWEGFLRDAETFQYWAEPWYYTVSSLDSDVINFAKRTMPRLAALITAEIEKEKRMSNNVDHIEVLHSEDFSIAHDKWEHLGREIGDDALAEINFLESRWLDQCATLQEGRILIRELWWSGEGSYDVDLFKEILTQFDGTADIVLTWENGERTGYRLKDHELTEHIVRLSLE
jgi:hypothetical protein